MRGGRKRRTALLMAYSSSAVVAVETPEGCPAIDLGMEMDTAEAITVRDKIVADTRDKTIPVRAQTTLVQTGREIGEETRIAASVQASVPMGRAASR